MRPAAYAVLNLQAWQQNLQCARQCAPQSKIMAVIKANAYGHGLLRAASALYDVDAFAVARIDEALLLREQGITKAITVLEGFSCDEELQQIMRYGLQPVIHCMQQLDILQATSSQGSLNIWLKMDTGMNRLGFHVDEYSAVHQRLAQLPMIAAPISLMTHLANADDLNDPKTSRQINRFKKQCVALSGARSIANSAGVLGFKEALTDWVRPGIMLYGVSPFPDKTAQDHGLQPVMSLHSRLIAIKHIKAGEEVGYGATWVCPQDTLMGVVAIGYGDGYPRQAPSGTPVLINGQRAPIIGRVSMDMITVDLGAHANARMNDKVTLWGDGLPVEEIAGYAKTIPYTLLCGITQRVKIVEEKSAIN